MADFPPTGPVTVTQTIPSYLYTQYNDDENLIAFVDGYNGMTQTYLDWFNSVNLPVYTLLSGSLLDWVANGLYGIVRPILGMVSIPQIGAVNTVEIDGVVMDGGQLGTQETYYLATDDIFKRIITWHFYKGDGREFTIPWLKNRVLRFLAGTNGTAPNVADTSGVSISFVSYTVTIDVSAVPNVPSNVLEAFKDSVLGRILELPPQYSFVVTI